MKTSRAIILSVFPLLIITYTFYTYFISPKVFTKSPVSSEKILQAQKETIEKFEKYNLDSKDKQLLEKMFIEIRASNNFTNATANFLTSCTFYLIFISIIQLICIVYMKFKN